MGAVVDARHDDVAALDLAHQSRVGSPSCSSAPASPTGPAALTIARALDFLAVDKLRAKAVVAPARTAFGAHQDARAAPARIERVEHDQARVVDAAIGIHEAVPETGFRPAP